MDLNQILDALYARYQEKQPQDVQYVFPPPATPDEIAAAEAVLGMPLPEELRALYARHAYMMHAWENVSITSVQFIAKSCQSLEDVASDMAAEAEEEEPNAEPFVTANGPVAELIYAPSRIPFGSDGNMDLLIDLDPPAGGTLGQIIRLDIEFGTIEVVANSLTEFFAQGLEAFSKEAPPKSIVPSWLVEKLLLLLSPLVALVMTIGGILVAVIVIAWSALSILMESIAGLFGRKQE